MRDSQPCEWKGEMKGEHLRFQEKKKVAYTHSHTTLSPSNLVHFIDKQACWKQKKYTHSHTASSFIMYFIDKQDSCKQLKTLLKKKKEESLTALNVERNTKSNQVVPLQ